MSRMSATAIFQPPQARNLPSGGRADDRKQAEFTSAVKRGGRRACPAGRKVCLEQTGFCVTPAWAPTPCRMFPVVSTLSRNFQRTEAPGDIRSPAGGHE